MLIVLSNCTVDEWTNFHERLKDLKHYYPELDEGELTRQWASCRGQTLYRTGQYHSGYIVFFFRHAYIYIFNFISFLFLVRGMMYYRQALNLQCYLENAGDNG